LLDLAVPDQVVKTMASADVVTLVIYGSDLAASEERGMTGWEPDVVINLTQKMALLELLAFGNGKGNYL